MNLFIVSRVHFKLNITPIFDMIRIIWIPFLITFKTSNLNSFRSLLPVISYNEAHTTEKSRTRPSHQINNWRLMKKFADEYIIFLSYGRFFLAVMVCDLCFVFCYIRSYNRFDSFFFVVVTVVRFVFSNKKGAVVSLHLIVWVILNGYFSFHSVLF